MNDDELRRRLHDAVDDVEPAYRLDEIRARTTGSGVPPSHAHPTTLESTGGPTKEVSMNESGRTWMVGVGGAVLATAAVIVAVVALGVGGGGDETPTAGDPTSSAPSTSASQPTPSDAAPSEGDDSPPDGGGTEVVVPVYYTVDTPIGPRLVREFRRTGAAGDSVAARVTAAVETAVRRAPNDPDYSTMWPDDTRVSVTAPAQGDGWVVELDSASTDLGTRFDGMDADTADAMRQQLVYTTQAVLQERTPIALRTASGGSVLGQSATTLSAAPETEVLALMNVTAPYERQRIDGDTLTATGRSSGFEANVIWEIRAGSGADGEVVDEGFTTAEGWMDRLYPWTVDIDVSDLEPGEYTFVARNDDPTGGAEGAGDSADTKTFVIQ